MAWTTPATATAGSTALTAAFWNEQVRDNMNVLAGVGSLWTSYTPTLAQGVSTNITKTNAYGKYLRLGTLVIWAFRLDVTGTGTGGSAITLTLPIAANSATNRTIGAAGIYDSSAGTNYLAGCYIVGTTIQFVGDWSGANFWGVSPNIAIASGDSIQGTVAYEVDTVA